MSDALNVENAVIVLEQTAERAARAKADYEIKQRWTDVILAEEIMRQDKPTLHRADRELIAKSSSAYMQALQELRDASLTHHKLAYRREAALACIEVAKLERAA